ncbi:MAG TPA: TetR/AcrR family transcriptional regulator [Saprospiraceae bacterium]|nr:TetR/AcrR family transcriptional regulator [Saprospiraceae bacterium]
MRNPEDTELGRDLLKYSIVLIHRMGIEAFTFKKLADEIGTTEASVYRYFENKHLLLVYLVSWYWTWLEYQIIIQTNNIKQPRQRLKK